MFEDRKTCDTVFVIGLRRLVLPRGQDAKQKKCYLFFSLYERYIYASMKIRNTRVKKPIPVYPSQLSALKCITNEYASSLKNAGVKISSFKIKDAIAKSLGYKSHSDLLNCSKKNAMGDNLLPFAIGDVSTIESCIYSMVPIEDSSLIVSACRDVNTKALLRYKNLQTSKKLFERIVKNSLPTSKRDVWQKGSFILITALQIALTYNADAIGEIVSVTQVKDSIALEQACKLAVSDIPPQYKEKLFDFLAVILGNKEIIINIALHGKDVIPSNSSALDRYGYFVMVFIPEIGA